MTPSQPENEIPAPSNDFEADPNAAAKSLTAKTSRSSSVLGAKYATRWDEALFIAFILALAWTPFWFGSNRPVAWGINAVCFGALALLYEIGLLATSRRHPVALRRIWFPALAFVVVCAWTFVQVATFLPVGYQHPIWQMARDALGENLPGSISVNRDDTIVALSRFVTCGLAFWLALQLCRSSARARRLAGAIAIIGGVYATYGIISFFLFPRTILWFDKLHYLDSVTSSFINRNSYATYAGIGLTAALAVTASQYLHRGGLQTASVGRKMVQLVALTIGPGGLWIACASIVGVALILTGSRGGFFATLGGSLTFLLLAGVRGRKNAVALGFGLLTVGLALGAAFFNYGDFLADRLTTQGLASDDRVAVYGLTWSSIADAPLLGFGDGTFQDIFPMYRDRSIEIISFWDKAHNSYLELLQGLGVPVALLFLAAIVLLAGRCVVAALTRRQSVTAPLAASAATAIVGLHAFVDFSLQIQAVALTWVALLGAGTAQSWSSKITTDR
jgi:O-antigen ligase